MFGTSTVASPLRAELTSMMSAMQLMAAWLATCLHAALMVLLSSLNEKLQIVILR